MRCRKKGVTMDGNQIRDRFLNFMKKRGHAAVAPAPLVLENDPTTLFTGSGMQPLLPYLLGKEHEAGVRLTDVQMCVRVQDIEDVGDNRHDTYFEMLGNWSLGDYFKEEQIRQFFEFLVDEVGLDPGRIYATCFIGDEENGIPRDTESAEIWQKLFAEKGIEAKIAEIGDAKAGDRRGMKPGERIFFYNDKENWWSRCGGIKTTPIGDPCGPDSEVFYDFGEAAHQPGFGLAHPASDSGRFIEIGNQVFMEYRRKEDGSFEPLSAKNVDFGGGLERIAAAAIDTPDIFETSLFRPIITELERISGKEYAGNQAEMRVVADHLRTSVCLAAAGLVPSNKEQGYVMRRLVRRAVLKALSLGIEQNLIEATVPAIVGIYRDSYPTYAKQQDMIVQVLQKEEKAFRQTLKRGLRELDKLGRVGDGAKVKISGEDLFMLQDTFGFPLELSVEEVAMRGMELSKGHRAEFDVKLAEQRERSRTATKGVFKGGLSDHSDKDVQYHTAAHLLMAALRQVLGDSVAQKGSNITAERIRLDYSWDEKLTDGQKAEIEKLVNDAIYADMPVVCSEHDTDYALGELGATGAFRDRYGDKVKVYTVGSEQKPVSREVCGGPHVENTRELHKNGEKFKIIKEESSSAGVRRVKAVLA